jgi:hypothetical protein
MLYAIEMARDKVFQRVLILASPLLTKCYNMVYLWMRSEHAQAKTIG